MLWRPPNTLASPSVLFPGSVKSLISMPCFMSNASIPTSVCEARGLTEDLVRISVGIEDVNDLIADLDHAYCIEHRFLLAHLPN
ncbi:hypothetical protein Dimus_013856 [Dionaea muscipula]